MDKNKKITHVLVYESDNVELNKLVKNVVESVGGIVKIDNTVVRQWTS